MRQLTRLDAAGRSVVMSWLQRPRYEVIPVEGIEDDVARVRKEVRVTVTASPRKGLDPTLDLAERLSRDGFAVVPHVSARLVRDACHLRDITARLTAIGCQEIFVVAGDAREPAGPFPDALTLLEELSTLDHGLRELGVTGYPERHPLIDDDVTIQAMWDKRRFATYIVSNLCFDPVLVRKWVVRVRRRGVALPMYVGMAGIADAARLLRISAQIGVGESARFVRQHANWFLRIVRPGGYSPGRFIAELLPDLARPERRVAGLHVFTFNEIESTERWRQEMLATL